METKNLVSDCCGADISMEISLDSNARFITCKECTEPCTPTTPMSEVEKWLFKQEVPLNDDGSPNFTEKEVIELLREFTSHLLNSISEEDIDEFVNDETNFSPTHTIEGQRKDSILWAIQTLENKLK